MKAPLILFVLILLVLAIGCSGISNPVSNDTDGQVVVQKPGDPTDGGEGDPGDAGDGYGGTQGP